MDLGDWNNNLDLEDYNDESLDQNFLDSLNYFSNSGTNQKIPFSQSYFFSGNQYVKEELDPSTPFFVPSNSSMMHVKTEPFEFQQPQQQLQPTQSNYFSGFNFQQQQYHQLSQQQQQQKLFQPSQTQQPSLKHQKLTSTQPPPPSGPHPKQELSQVDIIIDGQPPVEVRTRTPSELRTFSVTGRVVGAYRQLGASIVNIELAYAPTDVLQLEVVRKDILGGTKTVPILADGSIVFDNLSICESSTKHKEREFCLEFILLRNDGHELMRKRSRSFYAYSHKKVLQRRGSVKLRTLSKNWGSMSGGEEMHVIGAPFIQGPALGFIFRTPHGDVLAKPIEYFSDSVLFFTLPPYPLPQGMTVTPNTEIKVTALVTNDGRTFSNPLEFVYVAGGI